MKKTKHFNISVPELGDVPDITQVSNAISDLEDATAGTLEIMKAGMQGTKIILTSVSRKTKRTGYYEGMSVRFKSPQDIEPNYLKTISVDDLGDQELSVAYKVNRNEYIDIVYEGNKFTAYPVVVQKTDSVSNNSSVLVGTAKGVKTAYDKGVEALNKATQAQSSANNAQSTADGKVSKSGDTMTGELKIKKNEYPQVTFYNNDRQVAGVGYDSGRSAAYIMAGNSDDQKIRIYENGNGWYPAANLETEAKNLVGAINGLANDKEDAFVKKTGFNLEKTDSYEEDDTNKVGTARALKRLYDWGRNKLSTLTLSWDSITNKPNLTTTEDLNILLKNKVSKTGDTMTGQLDIKKSQYPQVLFYDDVKQVAGVGYDSGNKAAYLMAGNNYSQKIRIYENGNGWYPAANLETEAKNLVGAINGLYNKDWVTIYNTPVDHGTFITSQSIWDYKYLQITFGSDDEAELFFVEIDVRSMKKILSDFISVTEYFTLANGKYFWRVNAQKLLQDGKTFETQKTIDENCKIRQIRVAK